jgi:aminoglycoside phosphotransferase (APT) family kinase protein
VRRPDPRALPRAPCADAAHALESTLAVLRQHVGVPSWARLSEAQRRDVLAECDAVQQWLDVRKAYPQLFRDAPDRLPNERRELLELVRGIITRPCSS